MKPTALFHALIISTTFFAHSLAAKDLLPQGDFTSGSVGSLPEEWTGHKQPHLDRVQGSHGLAEEGDGNFLRLEKLNEESVLRVETSQKLTAGTKEITLSVTDRVIDISPGIENPNRDVFRVGVVFRDSDNEALKEGVPQIARLSRIAEWKTESVTYEVPEGTENVSIALMLLNCTGIWEVRSVELTAN